MGRSATIAFVVFAMCGVENVMPSPPLCLWPFAWQQAGYARTFAFIESARNAVAAVGFALENVFMSPKINFHPKVRNANGNTVTNTVEIKFLTSLHSVAGAKFASIFSKYNEKNTMRKITSARRQKNVDEADEIVCVNNLYCRRTHSILMTRPKKIKNLNAKNNFFFIATKRPENCVHNPNCRLLFTRNRY